MAKTKKGKGEEVEEEEECFGGEEDSQFMKLALKVMAKTMQKKGELKAKPPCVCLSLCLCLSLCVPHAHSHTHTHTHAHAMHTNIHIHTYKYIQACKLNGGHLTHAYKFKTPYLSQQ